MTTEALRLAIIGVGRMGAFHARSLAAVEGVSIVAVADASQASLAAVADVIGDATVYASVDAVFADRNVEACLIATPTPSHPDLVRGTLAAGLHVLCEKPLSLDPEESMRLGRLAKDAERVLQIGFWRRFSPPWVKAREAIVADRIGRPLLVRLSQWDADPPPAAFCDPAVSGGLAVDCGVHEFDLAEWLTGLEIERVRAWALPPVDGGLAEVGDHDNLLAVLELTGGALATVDLSRNRATATTSARRSSAQRGAVFIEILPSGRAEIGTAEGVKLMAGSEAADATAAGVVNQTKAFAATVRGAAVDVPGATASARATSVALAVQHAAATGEAVEVPSDREAAPWR